MSSNSQTKEVEIHFERKNAVEGQALFGVWLGHAILLPLMSFSLGWPFKRSLITFSRQMISQIVRLWHWQLRRDGCFPLLSFQSFSSESLMECELFERRLHREEDEDAASTSSFQIEVPVPINLPYRPFLPPTQNLIFMCILVFAVGTRIPLLAVLVILVVLSLVGLFRPSVALASKKLDLLQNGLQIAFLFFVVLSLSNHFFYIPILIECLRLCFASFRWMCFIVYRRRRSFMF